MARILCVFFVLLFFLLEKSIVMRREAFQTGTLDEPQQISISSLRSIRCLFECIFMVTCRARALIPNISVFFFRSSNYNCFAVKIKRIIITVQQQEYENEDDANRKKQKKNGQICRWVDTVNFTVLWLRNTSGGILVIFFSFAVF